MGQVNDIENVRRARIVADVLIEGDVDALVELSNLLEAAGTKETTRDFVLTGDFRLASREGARMDGRESRGRGA